jgi:accessory colonization factor AcfC
MKKVQAIAEFVAIYFLNSKAEFSAEKKKDKIAVRELWFEFTDSLCKNGDITEAQYNNWSAIC